MAWRARPAGYLSWRQLIFWLVHFVNVWGQCGKQTNHSSALQSAKQSKADELARPNSGEEGPECGGAPVGTGGARPAGGASGERGNRDRAGQSGLPDQARAHGEVRHHHGSHQQVTRSSHLSPSTPFQWVRLCCLTRQRLGPQHQRRGTMGSTCRGTRVPSAYPAYTSLSRGCQASELRQGGLITRRSF